MGRSSRILWFACVFAAAPCLGQARPAMVRMPTNIAPRLAMRSPAAVRARSLAGLPRIVMRPGATGARARRGAFAFDSVGLGLSLASDLAAQPLLAGGDGPLPEPEIIPAVALPPCPRPLIIKIGLGIRHPARTRVVYGTSTACVQ